MKISWHEAKASENERKHGVSFAEAVSALADPLATTLPDPDQSEGEHRFLTFGMSFAGRHLVVSHAEKGGYFAHHQRASAHPPRT